MKIRLYGVAIFLMLTMAAAAQAPAKKPACDRACLQGYMDRYLKAMLDRTVSDDLFARNVRFTENGIQLPLGNEGLWYGMSGMGTYRFYVPDIDTQQVALIGSVKENMSNHGVNDDQGNNVAIAVRLKIVDGKITEVEQLAMQVESTDGVYVVPAFVGLGAPYWDPHARGTIVGITRGTNRANSSSPASEAICLINELDTCEN